MLHWKKYIVELSLLAGLLAGICAGAAQMPHWQDRLIRLHVVANSDTAEDQRVKLCVRDAVLAVTEPLLEQTQSTEEARTLLQAHLPELEAAANTCLRDNGSADCASVCMQTEIFPYREYETFALPAGEYTALRVTIGAGQGHNWWCVVYPSLCLASSTEELTELAVSAGLTEEEAKVLTAQKDRVVIRLRILDIIHKIFRRT